MVGEEVGCWLPTACNEGREIQGSRKKKGGKWALEEKAGGYQGCEMMAGC